MNKTEYAIRKTFLRLYREISFEKMTVRGLCREVPVARTYFYEYYGSLAELKDTIEDELIGGILELAEECRRENSEMKVFFLRTLEYVMLHRTENYIFLVARPDLVYIAKWKDAIKKHFASYHPSSSTSSNYNLVLEVIASAVIGAYTYWMEHPEEVDTDKLAAISLRILSEVEKTI